MLTFEFSILVLSTSHACIHYYYVQVWMSGTASAEVNIRHLVHIALYHCFGCKGYKKTNSLQTVKCECFTEEQRLSELFDLRSRCWRWRANICHLLILLAAANPRHRASSGEVSVPATQPSLPAAVRLRRLWSRGVAVGEEIVTRVCWKFLLVSMTTSLVLEEMGRLSVDICFFCGAHFKYFRQVRVTHAARFTKYCQTDATQEGCSHSSHLHQCFFFSYHPQTTVPLAITHKISAAQPTCQKMTGIKYDTQCLCHHRGERAFFSSRAEMRMVQRAFYFLTNMSSSVWVTAFLVSHLLCFQKTA